MNPKRRSYNIGENNPMFGKHHSAETKLKIHLRNKGKQPSLQCIMANSGENNSNWKGDDVKYDALHIWIRRHLPKPEKCQNCGLVKRLEACNISGEYLRDVKDWEYLCRGCHMKKDGRMSNLKKGDSHLKRDLITGQYKRADE
jgi:NUMOD3 motif